MDGGKQHTVALQTHHLPGRQIHDGGQGLAHQFLRLIELVDTGEDLPVGAGAVIQREAQQLIGLFHGFAGLDLHHPEIGLAEGVEVHRFGELRLHLHVGLLRLLSGGFGGFQVRKSLVQIQTGEQVFTLDHGSGLRQFAPEVRRLPGPGLRAHADLGEELFHALRHEGGQQDTADAGGF